jgi:LysR family transcriptional regulator, transcriptional activator of the cysJI operon
MININELSIFLAAARCSSFSEAGRQLHLSQPAISQTIDNLEKRFGVKLFIRQGRSVRLTEAGQMLQPMAGELLASARRVEETMCSLQGEVVGEMLVGCTTASGKYLLPGLIARFREKYPHVRINVAVAGRSSIMAKLLAGEVSLGVFSKQLEHSDLEYQNFFNDELVLIVPVNHAWARFGQVYPDDLLDEPLILREEGAGTREELMQSLHEHDILPDMLTIAMVLGNAEAIVMAVEEGIGAAFVSRLSAQRSLDLNRVAEVKVVGMELKHQIYMARNRRFAPSRGQAEFWQFVPQQAPMLVKWTVPS